MPPDAAPGQVLSSVLPASEKRRRSKLGGCASVLFQIFHGKRLFPRKSLPAERLKHGTTNHSEDKLPIAKLLLIADENRGHGSRKDAEEELAEQIEDYLSNDEPGDEEKVYKRTPSVVARLMGLDSLPSSDLASEESNRLELQRKDMECQFLLDLPQKNVAPSEKSWKASAKVQPYTSSHVERTRESKTSLHEKFTTQQRKLFGKDKARSDAVKSKPKPTIRSSSLPPHHLDASFPSAVSSSKKGDNINKSPLYTQKTAHLLEGAAKMLEESTEHNTQSRKQKLQNSMSKSRMGLSNALQNHKGQSVGEQVDLDVRNLSSIAVPKLRRKQVGYAAHDESAGGGRYTLHEAAPGQRKGSRHQDASTQPRSNLTEKVKANWRRQEETSRRLSQPTAHRLKSLGALRIRHPSPPKSCQDSSGGPCSSQASNSISHGNMSLVKKLSIPVSSQFGEADSSLNSQDESISSAIYTESHRRSSIESSLSSDPSVSECTTSSEECSSFPIRADEGSSQTNFESLPTDLNDTTSSGTQSEVSLKWHKSAHTYSGKNTAAILQELLIALSSSSSLRTSEEINKPRVESTVSDSDLGQPEKPWVLPEANSMYTEDLQDSASCSSSDSSEIQQSLDSKPVEITESFLEETQREEESSADKQYRAQSCAHGEVPDTHTDVVDREALMSTLSELHDIDLKAIGLNVREEKLDTEDQTAAAVVPGGGLSVGLIDSALFDKLEKQAQDRDWGLSNTTTVSAGDDEDSLYKSDMESSFRNGYEEVAAQNKKLLTDCINEAFKSLSKQLYEVSSSVSEQSSASHVLNRVYRQIDEWRGMAISMNLDDMVEKEMSSTARRWQIIGAEAEEIAEAVESNILGGLMEEILLELI